MPALKKLIALAVLGVAISATFAQAADRKAAVEQVEFGIDAAKAGLWREATYRWERAVELDPGYAAAFNNLAIAYEQAGQFEKAKQAYQKAARARSEEHVHQAEHRPLQGNQRPCEPPERSLAPPSRSPPAGA